MGSRLDDFTAWLLIRPCEVLNCCWESSQSLLKVAELWLQRKAKPCCRYRKTRGKEKEEEQGKKHKEEAILAAAKEISVDAKVAETL